MRVYPGSGCRLLQDENTVLENCRIPTIREWEIYVEDRKSHLRTLVHVSVLGETPMLAKLGRGSYQYSHGEIYPIDFANSIFCPEHAKHYASILEEECEQDKK